MRSSALKIGDRVLVRNLTPRGGPGNLRTFWEKDVYVVVKRHGGSSPVYDVKQETGTGTTRTLHRNHLLPCDYLEAETWEQLPQVTRNRPSRPHTSNTAAEYSDGDDDDCSDSNNASSSAEFPPVRTEERPTITRTCSSTTEHAASTTHVYLFQCW